MPRDDLVLGPVFEESGRDRSVTGVIALTCESSSHGTLLARQLRGVELRHSMVRNNDAKKAKENTTMARIDKQAAREEMKKATHLKAKAEALVEIADELMEEAARHEHDALD